MNIKVVTEEGEVLFNEEIKANVSDEEALALQSKLDPIIEREIVSWNINFMEGQFAKDIRLNSLDFEFVKETTITVK